MVKLKNLDSLLSSQNVNGIHTRYKPCNFQVHELDLQVTEGFAVI